MIYLSSWSTFDNTLLLWGAPVLSKWPGHLTGPLYIYRDNVRFFINNLLDRGHLHGIVTRHALGRSGKEDMYCIGLVMRQMSGMIITWLKRRTIQFTRGGLAAFIVLVCARKKTLGAVLEGDKMSENWWVGSFFITASVLCSLHDKTSWAIGVPPSAISYLLCSAT